ncbi:MAG: hypothetical protein IPO92_15010 [Saprospiraceae bacterium]|nr:hypothetical protein [Saprospiraceae bacterium]
MPGLFDKEFKLSDKTKSEEFLKSELRLYLDRPRTNLELRQYILSKEFLPKHALLILKFWLKNNLITVITPDGEPKDTITNEPFEYQCFKNNKHIITIKYKK